MLLFGFSLFCPTRSVIYVQEVLTHFLYDIKWIKTSWTHSSMILFKVKQLTRYVNSGSRVHLWYLFDMVTQNSSCMCRGKFFFSENKFKI